MQILGPVVRYSPSRLLINTNTAMKGKWGQYLQRGEMAMLMGILCHRN